MSSLEDLREGLGYAWDNLAEGWRELWRRAEQAITRFRPPNPKEDAEPEEVRLASICPRWGLVPTEVYNGDDQVVVRLEAPGLEREDFELEVRGDVLWIRGEKRPEREARRGEYFLTERAYGRFERAVPLPARVDQGSAKARYRRGVLTVILPKSKLEEKQRIAVQAE